jgi:hypothetical protein
MSNPPGPSYGPESVGPPGGPPFSPPPDWRPSTQHCRHCGGTHDLAHSPLCIVHVAHEWLAASKKRSWIAGIAVILIIGVIAGGGKSGNNGSAPTNFIVSDGAVAHLVKGVTDPASGPQVACAGRVSCQITYTVAEPLGIFSGWSEEVQPTMQIWKGMFEDPQFQTGTITVDGPQTSIGGQSSTGPLFTLSCDRSAANEINWDQVGETGIKTLCSYHALVRGM